MDSIEKQTYSDLEIILVNDGSTDDSLAILDAYAAKDDRITVISQNNKGVAAARNTAIKNATGSFILFVDADDWIEATMVEKMHQDVKEENGIDIVFCCHDNLSSSDGYMPNDRIEKEVWDRKRQQYEFMRHKRMTGMLWNKLIRRELFECVWFDEDVGYGEDAHTGLMEIAKKDQKYVCDQ